MLEELFVQFREVLEKIFYNLFQKYVTYRPVLVLTSRKLLTSKEISELTHSTSKEMSELSLETTSKTTRQLQVVAESSESLIRIASVLLKDELLIIGDQVHRRKKLNKGYFNRVTINNKLAHYHAVSFGMFSLYFECTIYIMAVTYVLKRARQDMKY